MKNSLSTRLMYSFMAVVVIIVIGVTAGISYLIADYFFKIKEQELAQKGNEMADTIEYFIRKNDRDTLYRYIITTDRLVGAHIWLFDDKENLLVASYIENKKDKNNLNFNAFFYADSSSKGEGYLETQEGMALLDKEIREGNLSKHVKAILKDIYAGQSLRSQLFHPYYKEQVILVGVPYHNTVDNTTGALLMTESLSGFDNFLRNIYLYIVGTGIVALLISWIIVRGMTRQVVKPLVMMKKAAASMASGDYSQRVQVSGNDEVADLGNALNRLGSDLDAYVAKMERTEKIRRDFVANVSHELRTPITIIRGYNEAICDGIITDKSILQRYRGLINDETVRLERMVRELLDISRFQSSDPLSIASLVELPLTTILHNVIEKLMVNSAQKNVKFSVQADESIKILGNGDQMVQLIMILCDNALKYSPENGTVSLGVKREPDGSVLLSVSDQGPGIPSDDIPFIWERFYKVDKSHSRTVPGTGLGLAIAKEIVRIHGATGQVVSKCGVGTTFEIKFPKDKVV